MDSSHDSGANDQPIGNYDERFARKIAAVARPSARRSGSGTSSAGKFGGGGAIAVGAYVLIRLVVAGLSVNSRIANTPTFAPPAYHNVDVGRTQRDADAQQRLNPDVDRQRRLIEVRDQRGGPERQAQPKPGLQPVPKDGVLGQRPAEQGPHNGRDDPNDP
jgi:hypothetical protein